MAKRKKDTRNLTADEFKEALFQWAIRWNTDDDYLGSESILDTIRRYQENLPSVKLVIDVAGQDLSRIASALDDIDISEITRKSLREAIGVPNEE